MQGLKQLDKRGNLTRKEKRGSQKKFFCIDKANHHPFFRAHQQNSNNTA